MEHNVKINQSRRGDFTTELSQRKHSIDGGNQSDLWWWM